MNNQFEEMGKLLDEDFKRVKDIPHGHIQWKGTDVCIDLICKCGHISHFDGDFFYWCECPICHRKYYVCPHINLVELNDKQIEEANRHTGIKMCEE